MVESTGRTLAWVLVALAVTGAGVGIGLCLALSGSQTGVLAGEIRLNGPYGSTVSPAPGNVTIGALAPVEAPGRTCNLCVVPTVATQTVARGGGFRFALPPGSYEVSTREPYNVLADCGLPVRIAIRSGKTLSIMVKCVSTIG